MARMKLEIVGGDEMNSMVVLFSGGASSAKAIQEKYGNVSLAITNNPTAGAINYWYDGGVPVVINDFEKFYRNAKQDDLRNMETRKLFDELSVRYADAFEKKQKRHDEYFKLDAVIASGYMKKVTDMWLKRFPNAMLNVHPADLSAKDDQNRRKYTGDSAVIKALKAGETETRSTIHIMNGLPDQGPILVRSKPLNVEGLTDEIRGDKKKLKDFAGAHQSRMKDECDIPAFLYAVELLKKYRIVTDGSVIYIDGLAYPDGVEVGEI